MTKVFLGGTWNKENDWRREKLIPKLKIDYFNPIVDNWTPECQAEEKRQKDICDFLLYVITKEMSGLYSIAEVVDDSNKRPKKTIFCYLEEGFTEPQIKSLQAVTKLIKDNGAKVFNSLNSLDEVTEHLNNTRQSTNEQRARERLLDQSERIAQQEQPTED